MKLIDADKLSEMIRARAETLIEGKEAFYYIAKWIDLLPAAYVVEIPRCEDCKLIELLKAENAELREELENYYRNCPTF